MVGLFFTGTDTGVGKTYVAALCVRALVESGLRVGVYKPVASGANLLGDGRIESDDARILWEAAGRPLTLAQVCPQVFQAPLAPHLAAGAQGGEVDDVLLRSGLDPWRKDYDVVVVEGAGGLLSPLSDLTTVADLALDCGLPLVIVGRNALGTIHQCLSTVF